MPLILELIPSVFNVNFDVYSWENCHFEMIKFCVVLGYHVEGLSHIHGDEHQYLVNYRLLLG